MEGDIIMAESEALVGFAGRRDRINCEKLPDDFQKRISTRTWICRLDVERSQIRATVGQLLAFMEVNMMK